MSPKAPLTGDGFIQEFLPLVKNGFVILRSILDILIDRIEEAEQERRVDIRKETYESIVDALEAEVENVRNKEADTPMGDTKIEVLEAVISVLLNEMEELEARGRKGKRPHKVKID